MLALYDMVAESAERVVQALYEALEEGDVARLQTLIGTHLEWWFHGPPSERHLVRMLTGVDHLGTFHFVPQRGFVIGNMVMVEGHDRGVWWVHAWTVKGGIVTQLREYFNTTVTVTRVGHCDRCSEFLLHSPICATLWHSQLSEASGKSLPGLVLAI
ncbi:hypothetical protein O6H91_12G053900 [Diphasiastrum complanatum]|uniref:Uncharacterized protein n=1 Tax=Diphasiastrum complanatum TaxID=34168 RepID=A0ACC2C2B6_DIPCM|nr:hypothetical protein O6H91_12G053900 [Diphasiastrum complanatum]